MCDKYQELEKKIERYRTLATRVFDQPTIETINRLIEDQAEKAGLHPECKWGRLRPLLARRDFWEAAYGRPTKALIRRDTRCRDAAPAIGRLSAP